MDRNYEVLVHKIYFRLISQEMAFLYIDGAQMDHNFINAN